MTLLKKKKLSIPKRYIYIAALLFSVVILLQISGTKQSATPVIYLQHIVLFTSVYIFWALVIDYINYLIQPFDPSRTRFVQIVERVGSAIVLTLANLIATNVIYYSLLIILTGMSAHEAYLDFQPYIAKSILVRLLDISIIGAILKTIDTYQTVQRQKIRVVSLENRLHIAKAEALRYQLDPHFLFNALHTLNTLIGYDDKKAKSMLNKITSLLRNILEKRESQMITFKEELEYYTNYLEIEQERFYDRLEVFIDTPANTHNVRVPTLMLQPLIENAFKHGIARLETKGIISLKALLTENKLTIEVTNTSPPVDSSPSPNSTKIGLENLRKRLMQAYGEEHDFTVTRENGTYTARITIPQNGVQ